MRPLTPADLVVLSLLAERPMHGYELNRELQRRQVQDWAGVSRPQVYYSLRKLARAALITEVASAGPAGRRGGAARPARGPERTTWTSSAAGRCALAVELAREDWAVQRPPPPFLTWLALSPHAPPRAVRDQLARRQAFLAAELARERRTLRDIERDPAGVMSAVAALMVKLTIRHFQAELKWLDECREALAQARVRH